MKRHLPTISELFDGIYNPEDYSLKRRRTFLLAAMLYIIATIGAILLVFNLFFDTVGSLVYIDLFLIAFSSGLLFLLRYKKTYNVVAYAMTATMFVIFVGLLWYDKAEKFTLIWSYFFVPFVFISLGASRGIRLSIPYLLIVFLLAYLGIGEWMGGVWDIPSFIRFFAAHIALLFVMYVIVHTNERAFSYIATLRAKEREQLKKFEKLSITDPLTGLYNRRRLEEVFPTVLSEANERNLKAAYFILDLDYFKPFNDTYGHQEGDRALVAVAHVFKRHTAHAFRIGGEEFSGLLVGKNDTEIHDAIQALHRDILALDIPNEAGIDGKLTASVGAHIVQPGETRYDTIYRTADAALYKAKQSGRNRIVYL